jgi:hypothetical protein
VDRVDADGTSVLGQESTNPPISRPKKTPSLERAIPVARSDDHHHARDTARSRAEYLLWAMAGEKSRCLRAWYRRPLPIMSSLRAPESKPLTVGSEISQGIARRRVGNLCVDEKEKSASQAKRRVTPP